jgi:holo-[acyl-carrier protein] synthase
MSLAGIGTDIVQVARIKGSIERFGERFVRRILTDAEFAAYRDSGQPGHFLAKRFAAKEAAVKALGTGFSDGIGLHDIRVDKDERGRPLLVFSGQAERRCKVLGVTEAHISISDERDYALAFVVLVASGHSRPAF